MKHLLIVFLISNLLAGCNSNNVTIDNSLKQFFDANKVTGTFGMYDNGQGQFIIYNLSRYKDSAYLPASTYKIVNSLVGIETGKIVDENMIISWDGKQSSRVECDKDLTMMEAFKVSCVPYYQEVARRIGKDTMQRYLDTLGYGSRYTKATIKTIDSFWLDNSIKITADEQLGLVKKLYFDQLPFQKRTQRIVKEVMLQEKNANYSLSYKTGWGYKENGNSIGWIVGWIEENRHVYPFVLNIEGPNDIDMVTVRLNVLKSIFKHSGFMEGKK
jgi:beta-lactamase class D